MPFKFSLQEVLNHRKHIEEMRQKEMLEIQRQVDHVRGLLDQAVDLHQVYRRELVAKTQKGLPLASQEIYQNYLIALDKLIKKSEEHLASLRQEVEQRRAALLQAVQQRQVLDELKKEEQRQYLIQEKRDERKVFDEIAIRQFLLKDRQNIPN